MAKSFKAKLEENLKDPALSFMSPQTQETTERPAPAPEGYKINPLYLETKSKRVQLLVQPSLVKKIKARAKAEHRSMNDLIHSILEDAMRGE